MSARIEPWLRSAGARSREEAAMSHASMHRPESDVEIAVRQPVKERER
ncbi:MAG: hypothetical protein KIT88_04515 [Phycisphaeraceae bacterium]|nr:hypothetical protein [Phycisphaeraceae bacterium]